MFAPHDEKEAEKLKRAVRAIAGTAPDAFAVVMGRFEMNLKRCDVENRVKGYENTRTEAQALADFCDYVAACLRPEQTATQSSEDAESESAGPCT